MFPQQISLPPDRFKCTSRALGDVEQAMLAITEVENPEERKLTGSTLIPTIERTAPLFHLRLALEILTSVGCIISSNERIDDATENDSAKILDLINSTSPAEVWYSGNCPLGARISIQQEDLSRESRTGAHHNHTERNR